MRERSLARRLHAVPLDDAAEERALAVVQAAFDEREPGGRPARGRFLVVPIVAAAAVAAVAAAVLSPPGRAVVDAVRRSIGIEHAQPALFRLPATGRVLVSGAGGTWVVASDGSKRRLGPYTEASWSPHGRFVVAVRGGDELVALEPDGAVHWTLARPQLRFPRWTGSRTDTRIAYLSGSSLHVVAGDGTGDEQFATRVAAVAPAWRPGGLRQLAYVTRSGRVAIVDVERHRIVWRSRPFAQPKALLWLADGKRLVLATATRLVLLDRGYRGAAMLGEPLDRVGALSLSSRRLLGIVRGRSLLVVRGPEPTPLFVGPAQLAGLAWSPDGDWALTSLPAADQWVFVQVAGRHRVLAVSHIRRQFGGAVQLDGWAAGA